MQRVWRGADTQEGQLLLHQDQEAKEREIRFPNAQVLRVRQRLQREEQLRLLLHEQQVRLPRSPRQRLRGQRQVFLPERDETGHQPKTASIERVQLRRRVPIRTGDTTNAIATEQHDAGQPSVRACIRDLAEQLHQQLCRSTHVIVPPPSQFKFQIGPNLDGPFRQCCQQSEASEFGTCHEFCSCLRSHFLDDDDT